MKLDTDRLWTADETAFYLGVPKATSTGGGIWASARQRRG
jgi:hypothetical protein